MGSVGTHTLHEHSGCYRVLVCRSAYVEVEELSVIYSSCNVEYAYL